MLKYPEKLLKCAQSRRLSDETALRPLTRNDVEIYFQIADKNREFFRESGAAISNLETMDDARRSVEKRVSEFEQGNGISFVIEHDDRPGGVIGIRRIDWKYRKCMIGYFLSKDIVGKGVGARSVSKILELSFDLLQLNRIEATTATANVRSIRLLEKLGFQREGIMRENFLIGGRFVDDFIYSLLHRERRLRK